MMRGLGDANKILIFNNMKKLVCVFGSMNYAAQVLKVPASSVKRACDGDNISCRQLYIRYADSRIELEDEDFGKLNVIEYDKMCGNKNRKYYENKEMLKAKMIKNGK